MSSKEHNNSTTQTMPPKVHSNSIIQVTEQIISESSTIQNQSYSDSPSIITDCFMEAGVQVEIGVNKGKSNIILNKTSAPNMKGTSYFNNDTKNKEAVGSQKSKNKNNNCKSQGSSKRTRYIPIHTRRKVFQRANHCCEFTGPNQERCQSRYQLEIDHFIKPYSQGGDHSLDNLKLLST